MPPVYPITKAPPKLKAVAESPTLVVPTTEPAPPPPVPVAAPPSLAAALAAALAAQMEKASATAADGKAKALDAWFRVLVRADTSPRPDDAKTLLACAQTLGLANPERAMLADLETIREFRRARQAARGIDAAIERNRLAREAEAAAIKDLDKRRMESLYADGAASMARSDCHTVLDLWRRVPALFDPSAAANMAALGTVHKTLLVGETEPTS